MANNATLLVDGCCLVQMQKKKLLAKLVSGSRKLSSELPKTINSRFWKKKKKKDFFYFFKKKGEKKKKLLITFTRVDSDQSEIFVKFSRYCIAGDEFCTLFYGRVVCKQSHGIRTCQYLKEWLWKATLGQSLLMKNVEKILDLA